MKPFNNVYEAILWAVDNAQSTIVVYLKGCECNARLQLIDGKWYWDYGTQSI